MLTIWIHLDTGDLRKANVPEDYSTGDLLADVLRAAHPGSPRMEWGLYDGDPKKVLLPGKTLAQNEVKHDAHLHLFSRAQLALEIDAPGHAALRRELSPSTSSGALLTELVRHFQLTGLPGDWQLVRSGSTQGLDPDKTLAANGVRSGEWLSVQAKQSVLRHPPLSSEVTLTISEPKTGKTARRTYPGSTVLNALLRDAVETFGLPATTRMGRAQAWILIRQGGREALDLDRTLEGNGLTDGAALELKGTVAEPQLVLTMIAPGGAVKNVEAEAGLGTEHLLRTALRAFALPETPKKYRLRDKSRNDRELNPAQTLGQNGVADNASLQLVPIVFPWWMVAAGALSVAVVGALLWFLLRPPRISVEVTSSRTALHAAQTAQLSARLTHAKDPNVLWSLSPRIGEITSDGTYTAPGSLGGMVLVHVTAISREDTGRSGSVDLTLTPAPTESVSPSVSVEQPPPPPPASLKVVPAAANIFAGQARRFAVVPDAGSPVRWQISPPVGRVGADGVYVAPTVIAQDGTVTLTALLPSGGSAGTATIRLRLPGMPAAPRPDGAAVEGIQATRGENGQTVLRALDRSGSPAAVNWTLTPEVGSISTEGVYTPPARAEVARDVTVRAISRTNPGNSVAYTLHVAATYPAGISVLLGPEAHLVMRPGERKTFTATVKGTANSVVTWSAMGGGNIFPNGMYVAPPNVPQGGAHARIRATSNANPTVYGEAEITLRPATAPSVAREGTFLWQGKLKRNQTLTIRNNIPSTGGLSGALPAGPVDVRPSCGDCEIVVAPSAENGWSVLALKAKSNQSAISFSWSSVASSR